MWIVPVSFPAKRLHLAMAAMAFAALPGHRRPRIRASMRSTSVCPSGWSSGPPNTTGHTSSVSTRRATSASYLSRGHFFAGIFPPTPTPIQRRPPHDGKPESHCSTFSVSRIPIPISILPLPSGGVCRPEAARRRIISRPCAANEAGVELSKSRVHSNALECPESV